MATTMASCSTHPYPAKLAPALVLPLLLVAACVPARPKLAPAPVVSASDWGTHGTAVTTAAGTAVGADHFWHGFGSARLEALIGEGLADNASLDAARARVLAARAIGQQAHAALLPNAHLTTTQNRTQTNVGAATAFSYNATGTELDVAYDLDLFGAAKASNRAAQNRTRAAIFDNQAMALVIETEIARGYVTLSAAQARIAVTRTMLDDARALQSLVELRQHEGEASSVDAARQTLEVRKLEAEMLSLEQARRADLTALAVLLGREAPHFDLTAEDLGQLSAPALNPGQPGDLVLRRPDLRAAEARITAANGDVTAARAAFLPDLSLSASGLGQALAVSGPFGWTAALGANLLTPIFSGGRLRGAFNAATAAQKESVALYRQTLLGALQEGCNALSAVEISQSRIDVLAQAAQQASQTTHLSHLQYREGEADLMTAIDARRNEAGLRQSLIDAEADRLLAAIDVYKALGGAPAPALRPTT